MLKFCKKYIFRYKTEYAAYLTLGLLLCVVDTMLPTMLGQFINLFESDVTFKTLLGFIGVLAFLYVLKEIGNYFSKMVYIRLQTNSAFALNLEIVEHLKKLSPLVVGKNDSAYLSQRINNDANDILIFFIGSVTNLIFSALSTIIILVLIFVMDRKAFLITLILLFLYLAVYVLFKRTIYRKSYDMKEESAGFFARLQEQLEKSEFIKIHGTNAFFVNKLVESFNKLYNSIYRQQKTSQIFLNVEGIIGAISLCILFLVGGIEIIKGNMQIGYFFVISSYFNMILEYGKSFVDYGREYQEAYVSYDRIESILSIKEQPNGEMKIEDIDTIAVKNLKFAYNKIGVIDNLDIKLTKGNLYGLCGENGTGKSTFIKLILGLYIEDYQGEITYNGINIKDLNMDYIRQNLVGYTEQEPLLLADTVYNNMVLYREIEGKKILSAINIFSINDIIKESNWEHIINEKSSNISGGEKQKIAIARQMVRDNSLMIFDEPTSALDVRSVEDFLELINLYKKDRIIIIISHDDRILNKCDVIVEF